MMGTKTKALTRAEQGLFISEEGRGRRMRAWENGGSAVSWAGQEAETTSAPGEKGYERDQSAQLSGGGL